MKTLIELEKRRIELNEARKKLADDYKNAVDANQKEASEIMRLIGLKSASLDLDLINLAEHVIYVSGLASERNSEGLTVISDAINDLAVNRGKLMRSSYFGSKNYSGWSDQRCNCEYGMGPRHGHIVFEIGLTKEARTRDLLDAEIEACLYYLNNINPIQAAQKQKEVEGLVR